MLEFVIGLIVGGVTPAREVVLNSIVAHDPHQLVLITFGHS